MSETTTTPPTAGNWSVVHGSVMSDVRSMPADAAIPICHLALAFKSSEEMAANGRLICAAKGLLDACEYFLSWLEEPGLGADVHPSVPQKLRAAIAAAREGEPT